MIFCFGDLGAARNEEDGSEPSAAGAAAEAVLQQLQRDVARDVRIALIKAQGPQVTNSPRPRSCPA